MNGFGHCGGCEKPMQSEDHKQNSISSCGGGEYSNHEDEEWMQHYDLRWDESYSQ